MKTVEELIAKWKEDGYINPDALEAACSAMELLLERIKQLEETINK